MNLLSQFSGLDQLEHLRILKFYTPNQGRPWSSNVQEYIEGIRQQRNITAQTQILSKKNYEITQEMREDGWCQSTIQLLLDGFHVPGLNLAKLLGPPTIYEKEGEKEPNHTTCSLTQ